MSYGQDIPGNCTTYLHVSSASYIVSYGQTNASNPLTHSTQRNLDQNAAHLCTSLTPSLKSTLLTIPHTLPHPLPKLLTIFPPHLACLDIRRAFIIRASQHADDAEKDGLWSLHGIPTLGGRLIAILVILRRVQYADAHLTGRVDVGVKEFGDELECGWHDGVGGWEGHERFETATWEHHYV